MRFFRDRPDLLTPILWYIVPNDRPELGVPTIFGNRQWELEHNRGELGEQPSRGTYFGGAAPFQAGGCGLLGTEDEWLNGCLFTKPIPAPDPFSGAPAACCGPRYLGMGGIGIGAPTVSHNLLQENGARLLTEDGGSLLWE